MAEGDLIRSHVDGNLLNRRISTTSGWTRRLLSNRFHYYMYGETTLQFTGLSSETEMVEFLEDFADPFVYDGNGRFHRHTWCKDAPIWSGIPRFTLEEYGDDPPVFGICVSIPFGVEMEFEIGDVAICGGISTPTTSNITSVVDHKWYQRFHEECPVEPGTVNPDPTLHVAEYCSSQHIAGNANGMTYDCTFTGYYVAHNPLCTHQQNS